MNKTFKAKVSADMITKATRLFNATLEQILTELLQNARRAGATVIDISYTPWQNNPEMYDFRISDNGKGCANPQDMFHLGQSAWDTDITTMEDPAGMGVFALAGCEDVKIVSKTTDNESWTVCLESDHFNGKADIEIYPSDMDKPGTEIYFSIKIKDKLNIDRCINHISTYLPVKVLLNGQPVPQLDFLHDAIYTEQHQGITYGICLNHTFDYYFHRIINVNFYGLSLEGKTLPTLNTLKDKLCIKIDVLNTNGLELVLPQRNEIVKNDKFNAVCHHAYKVLYKYIQNNNMIHSLPYKTYQHAQSLGYDIGEAQATLSQVCGKIDQETQKVDVKDNMYFLKDEIIDKYHYCIHDFMATMVSANPVENITFLYPDESYKGYSWYKNIPSVTDITLWCNGKVYDKATDPRDKNQIGWKVHNLHMKLQLSDGKSIKHPIGMFISGETGITLDGISEFWIEPNIITLGEVIDIFEKYMFDYYGSDNSYDEDFKYYKTEIMATAIKIAYKDQRIELIDEIIHQSGLSWYMKLGESYTITKTKIWKVEPKRHFAIGFWIKHLPKQMWKRLYNTVKNIFNIA